jgi:cytochrome b6-f complex iron-sulfur subunit
MGRNGTGITRRELLRHSLGAGIAVWLLEVVAGSIGFLWPSGAAASPRVRAGTVEELAASSGAIPFRDGFPAYVPAARAFVVLVDPTRGFVPGSDVTGTGDSVNVIALSQVCPHLGCRPNPCLEDWWMHCPCHQSRYDRLGIKVDGERYGPAPRGMDRFAVEVDEMGVLTVDTSRIILGPLPVALGQPGIIPPRVPHGCT